MGRFYYKSDDVLANFVSECIPKKVSYRVPEEGSDPILDDYPLALNEYPVPVSFF